MASNINLPQLTPTNFSNWKFRVECLLEEKGVKETVQHETDISSVKDKERQLFLTQDAKAKSIIVQCITDRHIEYIKDCTSAFDMMKKLKNIFERKSTMSKLMIRRKLISLKCEEGTDLQDHFVNFDAIVRDLEGTGSKLEESDKICHLLATLPGKFENVIMALETSTCDIDLDFVKNKLLDFEMKLKNSDTCAGDNIKECSFRASYRCYGCGSADHYIADCPKRSNSFRGRGRGNRYRHQNKNFNHRINLANDSEESKIINLANDSEESVSYFTYTEEVNILEEGNVNFILDSGATNHLVSQSISKYMTEVVDIPTVTIKVANGDCIFANKKGKLTVRCQQSPHLIFSISALIVQDITCNLLSVHKLSAAGLEVIFKNQYATIIQNNKILFSCKLNKNLFLAQFLVTDRNNDAGLMVDDINVKAGLTVDDNNAKNDWHLRLGHLNRRGLQLLGLPWSKQKCESCMKGKFSRLPFKIANHKRSSRVGELLHSDIWGPAATPTSRGERYYLSIVDDFSHFCVLYLLNNKAEASTKLINHIKILNSEGKTVSKLRTDNGREYVSQELKSFCSDNGIIHEFTCTYTPQQTGVSERLNRTLLDRVRTMFVDTGLPKHLWGEAVRSAAYQLNRCPSSALSYKVPAEIYYGKLILSKLKIFGCKAWAYNLPKNSSKLEPRAKEYRLVGYGECGYRLWDPYSDKTIISRDVRFDESDYCYEKVVNDLVSEKLTSEGIKDGDSQDNNKASRIVRNKEGTKLPSYEDYQLYSVVCSGKRNSRRI